MRTFYIFNISSELAVLTKDVPYMLYKTISDLYYMDKSNSNLSYQLYKNIFNSFNKDYVDKRISNLFKHNKYYIYENNMHIILNKYTNEETYLKVYKSHIVLKSNIIKPTLLFNYLSNNNLFVCDFKDKDYFYLEELVEN